MTKVYVSSVIPAPAADVWNVVRDFNGLPGWAPFVAESRIEQNAHADRIGCIRNFTLKDGGRIREKLLALSDYDLSCSYAILESPMPVENYVATLSLTPITDGNMTLAEWQADTDVDGFNLAYAITPGTFEDVVTHVVPVLTERGQYPEEYVPGTLRHKLVGRGDRLPDEHRGARYRIGGPGSTALSEEQVRAGSLIDSH